MASLKSLAKDTAIYGLSSIVGRFLNYLLVPLYTAKISAASGGYGVVTNVYAYVALLLVLLTYGMETTFFRFANRDDADPRRVYGTVLTAVGFTSLLFMAVVVPLSGPIAGGLGYGGHSEYVWTMAVTVAVDAFLCIPFAYLRYKKKAVKFAALKLFNIGLSIVLNLFCFLVLPLYTGEATPVGYVFFLNLGCTLVMLPLLGRELSGLRHGFDWQLLRRMSRYTWPILVLGIAGILNQTADKILFPYIYRGPGAHTQLGIYGAASKIAMIMAMITQAFRYAYEPFVFGASQQKDKKETYASAMKYFVVFTLVAYLLVVGYMPLLRHIIAPDYWAGLDVVPVVMAAEIMMGVYFNLSFWYKLIDKTIWGAWFSGAGCAVLILANVLFVPRYGYMACAWAGVAGYGTAMLLSYFVGQRYYPIAYPVRRMAAYAVLALALTAAMMWVQRVAGAWVALGVDTLLVAVFVGAVLRFDFPLGAVVARLRRRF